MNKKNYIKALVGTLLIFALVIVGFSFRVTQPKYSFLWFLGLLMFIFSFLIVLHNNYKYLCWYKKEEGKEVKE